MVNYWIFAFSEYSDFAIGSAEELFNRVARDKRWRLGRNAQNRLQTRKGDQVIFLKTGGQEFLADAVLDSELQSPCDGEIFRFVLLSNLHQWANPLPIKMLVKRLSFQKQKSQTQCYFQMAIRRITKTDYENLLAQANT
jgi:hypothetical protein